MHNDSGDERLEELLMQRATGALSAPEADALAQALSRLPPDEVTRWEHAAAELTAVLAEADASAAPMPASLADRIIDGGEAIVRSEPRVVASHAVPATAPTSIPPRLNVIAWTGWLAAAAALVVWIAAPRAAAPVPVPVTTASVRTTPRQLRDSLIAADTSSAPLAWTATTDSSAINASGDVVWSNRAQLGVMRIAGLQVNDRTRWQYQLWIFDRTRDRKYPVDGGVFDVPAGQSQVYVPIDARVPVGDAVMFAITVEPAGGVVVSTRERIALLAQRKT